MDEVTLHHPLAMLQQAQDFCEIHKALPMCLYTVAMCHYVVVFTLAVCVVSCLPMCPVSPQSQLVTADGFHFLRLCQRSKWSFIFPLSQSTSVFYSCIVLSSLEATLRILNTTRCINKKKKKKKASVCVKSFSAPHDGAVKQRICISVATAADLSSEYQSKLSHSLSRFMMVIIKGQQWCFYAF